jgi:hypothetical protein
MRNLAVAFLLGLTVLLAHAQPIINVDKPVVCSDLKTVIELASGEFQEIPSWSGNDSISKFIIMANKKTGTWTFIQYNDKIACVLATGENARALFLGKNI